MPEPLISLRKINLIDRGRGVRSAFVVRPFRNSLGAVVQAFGAVRIKHEGDGYRIDRCDSLAGAWLPWEPIDPVSHATEADALAALLRWAEAHDVTEAKDS